MVMLVATTDWMISIPAVVMSLVSVRKEQTTKVERSLASVRQEAMKSKVEY